MPYIPDIALGAIVAAFITGVISLLGLIIAKEQKVSDFRQAWIDELRQDLSAFLGHMGAIVTIIQEHASANSKGLVDTRSLAELLREDLSQSVRRVSSIRLRLNPEESKDMLTLLNEFESLFKGPNPPKTGDLDALEKKLVAQAQPLLKQEWDRVKTGEPVFRLARGIALTVVLAAIVVLGIVVGRSF